MLTDKKKAAQILLENDDFLILCHANPDGDTLGCGYGLCGILQKMGKRAKVLCADPVVSRMQYLKDSVVQQEFTEKTIVSVDVADTKLLGALEKQYGDKILLAIDHHESRKEFAQYTFVDPDAAAACELIYEIALEMGAELDGKIAACLYTGIATDTGCFKFTNTTTRTHRIAGELMAYDFPHGEINYQLFDLKSKGRIELEQRIIRDMEFTGNDKIAIVWLTLDIMREFGDRVDTEDFNGLASLPRQIEGVVLGVTVKQKEENLFKISMRSTEQINAAEVCGVFGGGGHARAAGCTIEGNLQFVKAKLLPVLEKAVEQI